jgi:hypothetical protein
MAVIPRLFKEDFALTFFESEAKHRFCFRGCRSVLDQTARIWFLCLLSCGGLQDDVIKYKSPCFQLSGPLKGPKIIKGQFFFSKAKFEVQRPKFSNFRIFSLIWVILKSIIQEKSLV